jgi:hypothetical protein
VFAAGAESVVASLDAGRFRTGDAALVGLRVLAMAIVARMRAALAEAPPAERLTESLADLDATLGIASGPRLARQIHLGEAARRAAQSAP